ncbi:hypothetical protein, partial [Undibacterium sp. RuTC16W]|uniref:hypothetical protein n=1 Tax=Undibacterium sp. RuTC16W TaxID=3413048 RepID=UPI003BF26ED9
MEAVHAEHARQCAAFFQKFEPLNLGIDKEQVAWGKFVEAEDLCRETNRIFRLSRKGLFHFEPFVDGVLYTAKRKIAILLGDVPRLAHMRFRFGPGATTTTKKKYANWAVKLSSRLECSANLVPLLPAVAQQVPHWFFLHAHACSVEKAFTDVSIGYGQLQFVPKSAKTYRSIIVER